MPLTRNVEFETGWISNSNTNAKTLSHDGSRNSLLIAPNPRNGIARVCFRVWVRVWVRVWGQSLGSESGVSVRVWVSACGWVRVWSRVRVEGQSLEFGSEFGARVWRLRQSLGPESGVDQRLGQSLVSESRVWVGRGEGGGGQFGARV